ncbi:hypothetical protein K491DRAFT_672881 [Lophiostoma macrostomum CBS 122681]|uniref:Uncharacterized protein n=1 Tax=Lophiostoma macrostomum CBS 122681 TaxID=1314788 RepID=A0A6A6TW34_9PLEO|nr:hypothetical protein K491DRAFT_672881 [Lophiostoma macrostomum CBS 122681]
MTRPQERGCNKEYGRTLGLEEDGRGREKRGGRRGQAGLMLDGCRVKCQAGSSEAKPSFSIIRVCVHENNHYSLQGTIAPATEPPSLTPIVRQRTPEEPAAVLLHSPCVGVCETDARSYVVCCRRVQLLVQMRPPVARPQSRGRRQNCPRLAVNWQSIIPLPAAPLRPKCARPGTLCAR